jgi:hypothetical protein
MISSIRPTFRAASKSKFIMATQLARSKTSQAKAAKKEGDISSVFVSLSGASTTPLPERFANIKRKLISGNEDRVCASWHRLLDRLAIENEIVSRQGPAVIPQIDFRDLTKPPNEFIKEVRKRGVAVVKGVVPEDEARAYKTGVEEYVKANPGTKGKVAFRSRLYCDKSTRILILSLQLFLLMIHKFMSYTGLRLKSELAHILT